jgi:hypothetical protein
MRIKQYAPQQSYPLFDFVGQMGVGGFERLFLILATAFYLVFSYTYIKYVAFL